MRDNEIMGDIARLREKDYEIKREIKKSKRDRDFEIKCVFKRFRVQRD